MIYLPLMHFNVFNSGLKNLFCPLKVPVKGFRIGVPPLSSTDKKNTLRCGAKNARNSVCGQAHILRCVCSHKHTQTHKSALGD